MGEYMGVALEEDRDKDKVVFSSSSVLALMAAIVLVILVILLIPGIA